MVLTTTEATVRGLRISRLVLQIGVAAHICLTIVLLAGCLAPSRSKPAPPRSYARSATDWPKRSSTRARSRALERASEALRREDLAQVEQILARVRVTYPDDLEAWVIDARLARQRGAQQPELVAWLRVERILTVKGLMRPFVAPENLYAAADFFLRDGRFRPANLFLESLWRLFPLSSWSGRARARLAEAALRGRRWALVEDQCRALESTMPSLGAENAACKQLVARAARLRDLGPEPSPQAARWIWEAPSPQGNDLRDVWLGPGGELWAVGRGGTIVHRRAGGKRLETVVSPTRWSLYAIAGRTAKQLYVVGAGGVILTRDPTGTWSTLRTPSVEQTDLRAVCVVGSAPSLDGGSVWAAGEDGTVLQLDTRSGNIARMSSGLRGLHGLWCAPNGRVYAVGEEGALYVFEQGAWRTLESNTYERLRAVMGVGKGLILAVGDRRTLVTYDGDRGTEHVMGSGDLYDLWSTSGGRSWVVGRRGAIFRLGGDVTKPWVRERLPSRLGLWAVTGRGDSSVVAAGLGGTVLERRGKTWKVLAGGAAQSFVGLSMAGPLGRPIALSRDGTLWRRQERDGRWRPAWRLPQGTYRALWGDRQRMLAVGDHGLLVEWRGSEARQLELAGPGDENLRAVVGLGTHGFAAVGEGGIALWRRGEGQVRRARLGDGHTLNAVAQACGAGDDVWSVGDRGAVLRFHQGRWRVVPTTVVTSLRAVQCEAGGRVFVAGDEGVVFRWSGTRWREEAVPSGQNLVGIWAQGGGRLIAVGEAGTILQRTGDGWRVEHSPAGCLRAVSGNPSTGDVFAVGCHGTIVRRLAGNGGF